MQIPSPAPRPAPRIPRAFGVTLFLALLLVVACLGGATGAPAHLRQNGPASVSPNECFANGSFSQTDAGGKPAVWAAQLDKTAAFEHVDGHTAIKYTQNQTFQWDMPGKPIWNTDYVFTFRVKGQDAPKERLCLWTQLPDQHEPPNGPLFTEFWQGTFDWKTVQLRFHMPSGIARFMVFFNGANGQGASWLTDFSMRPVDDAPLELDTAGPSLGSADVERLTWIWKQAGFPWTSRKMTVDQIKPGSREEVWFRRTITCPDGMTNPQAVFVGDDSAGLSVNGKDVGSNQMVQDIKRVLLDNKLHSGQNTVLFKVVNTMGPGGLLGRIEWQNADGTRTQVPTDGKWECSEDTGNSWRPASEAASPAPAPAQFHWVYPHLALLSYGIVYAVPADLKGARLATRATGGLRVEADGKTILQAESEGQLIKADLGSQVQGAKQIRFVFEDICRAPAGQIAFEIKQGDAYKQVAVGGLLTDDGHAPATVQTLYSERTWPIDVGAFEAAATRPIPDRSLRMEDWAQKALAGSQQLWKVGGAAGAFAGFGDMTAGNGDVTLPLNDLKQCPLGLEAKTRPELTFHFNLDAVPANGAAFALGVEDADPVVTSVGVFVNGILCGNPQVFGYSQVPGARPVRRYWLVTIPAERFRKGANALTLRLLPSYYQAGGPGAENQAEDYVRQFRLGDRTSNPYGSTAWLHWDTLSLSALAQPISDSINGRPVWMGVNIGYLHLGGTAEWKQFILRDLCYMGLEQAGSPLRMGVWDQGMLGKLNASEPALPAGSSAGDFLFSTLRDKGMKPYLVMEPGRNVNSWDDFQKSNEVAVIKRYGKYVDAVEIGNEVDNPYYGWNARTLGLAYAEIQKQSACGQALKAASPDAKFQIMGEGWYHAWDFSTIDAQARQETPQDPGWTDYLGSHDYGKSYIVPAITYYTLYGSAAPKPIWVTECGAYTADDDHIGDFDLNLRGNIGFATFIVQYLLHPYNAEMRHFSMLSAVGADAQVLEKARCYRRLIHTFAMHGAPLPWTYADPTAMKDRLVVVNPVDTGKVYKISFINYSHDAQQIDVRVTMPKSGALTATRYGDGKTVAEGSKQVALTASPQIEFKETLAPGETVEYLAPK